MIKTIVVIYIYWYGTRHILETLEAAGHKIDEILVCGGLSQNPLFIQIQADVLGLPVFCPVEKESVLIGAAILGSYAAGKFNTIYDAIKMMGGCANIVKPRNQCHRYHLQKYRVFRKMVQDQNDYREIMNKDFL